jgi:hypothetical protein
MLVPVIIMIGMPIMPTTTPMTLPTLALMPGMASDRVVLLARFQVCRSMGRARAPSTAGPLQDSVLAVAPAGDSALCRAARRFCVSKTLTKGELHD